MRTANTPLRGAPGRSKRQPVLKPRPQSSKTPFDVGKIRLLRGSFALIEPRGGIAGLVFYRNLFLRDPSLRPLFQSSIDFQARKLMESLSYTIASLENPKSLAPVLEAMGRRHVTYGARAEHYDTVIAALLETLAEVLGSAFSPEVRDAWKTALSFVAETMKRGAAETESLKEIH